MPKGIFLRIRKPVIDRFIRKFEIDHETECWNWIAGIDGEGYGSFWLYGKNRSAHRVAYQISVGQIPEDMYICHSCDNPLCVNPDHLWLGTQAENLQDMRDKGRQNEQGLR